MHWQACCLSVTEKYLRQSLHRQDFACQWMNFIYFCRFSLNFAGTDKLFACQWCFFRNNFASTDKLFACQWMKKVDSLNPVQYLIWFLTSFLLVSENFVCNLPTADKLFACQWRFFFLFFYSLTSKKLVSGLSADTNTHYLCKNALARRESLKQWIAETLVRLSWTSW